MTSPPKWRETTEGAWDCGDPAEDFFRLRAWSEFGFDLVDWDHWLGTLPPCDARTELLRIRGLAKVEMQAERMESHLHLMWTSRQAIEREAKAQPLVEEGARVKRGRSIAGQKTAKQNRDTASARSALLLEAALGILRDEPRIKDAALASMLADRGHGGREAIRKKLAKLLPKKSVETR